MSKKSNVNNSNALNVGWGYGYVIFDNTPSQIEGKVLTILESAGLPDKQEEALKGLIRSAIWSTIHEQGIYISDIRHTQIRQAYWDKKKEIGENVPISAI